jgi:uncharacterized protein with ATP-grasp and redox domains
MNEMLNPRAVIGANAPPTAIDLAAEAARDLAAFANDNPALASMEAKAAFDAMIKRGKEAAKDLEAERTAKVKPLNEEVKAINGAYKAAATPLDAAIAAVERPVKAFLLAEEDRRRREAEDARRRAAEIERQAREAEARERAAIEEAAAGVADANVVDLTIQADQTFDEFQRASRFAARAERDAKVKGLRTLEVLTITDHAAAALAMTDDADLSEAIKTAARRYRKTWGDLPPGITPSQERV